MKKTNQTFICGVIGSPIEHSLSPMIHHYFAEQYEIPLRYKKILGDPKNIEQQILDFFSNRGLGLNVTSPFKSIAFQLAKHHSYRALSAKTANTLWVNDAQELCADNTDGLGLLFSLQQHTRLINKRVLLIGAGGAAHGVIQPLLDAEIASLTITNRSEEKLPPLQRLFPQINICPLNQSSSSFDIIINTTTSSMLKTVPNIPLELLKNSLCLDMYYDRNADTKFVELGKEQGAKQSIDGLEMLVGQAAASFSRWHKINITPQNIRQNLKQLQTHL
jgi:shikimate dehydrogenase